MNNKYNNFYEDEEEIDLIDLINNCLWKNIKKIIIVTVVGGLIGLGFATYKANKEDKIVAALLEDREAALKEYEDDVTESDLLAVDAYEHSLKAYETEKDYLNNSILLSLDDSKDIYIYKANIRVRNSKDIDGVISTISATALNDEFLDGIAKELGYTNNSEYYDDSYFINELISVESTSNNNILSADAVTDNTISVSFTYNNYDLAKKIGDEIIDKIISIKDTIYEESGASIYVMNNDVSLTNSVDINKIINESNTELTTIASGITTAGKDFNNIQLKYYAALNPEEEIEDGQGKVKYIAIGFIAGAVIICGYYVLVYILENKLHTADELSYLGFKVYGLTGKNPKELIQHTAVKDAKIINKLIELDLDKNNIKEIVLATSLDKKEIEDIVASLSKDIKVSCIYDHMFDNQKFIEECKKDIAVVVIEKIGVTRRSDIGELKKFVSDYKLNLSGVVVTE